jgi:hypothetical protein
MKTLSVSILVALTFPLSALAQSSIVYERALLPITVRDVAGAYGSVWNTELWIKVDDSASRFIAIDPLSPAKGYRSDPGGFIDPWGPVIAPYAYPINFYRTQPGQTPGSLIYVSQPESDEVHFSLRLSNGKPDSNPVELPVVRERYFTTSTLHILGIPLTTSGRAMLRIYGIDPSKTGSVRVKAFLDDGITNGMVLDAVVPLTVVQKFDVNPGRDPLPIRPPAAELNLSTLLAATPFPGRLEITPVDPTLRLWAFVSITDNLRQDVVLRTPN